MIASDPLTFDKLMATPIDFFKFSMNHLKLDKITKAGLVRPVYKLLQGTCQSSIELKYNMEECYKALSDQLDWTNLKGDSVVKVGYNKGVEIGISLWGPKRQLFYRPQINRLCRHDVYSTLKILSMVSVMIHKKFGHGYLKEIVVRRADSKLYKFKEGDFINLHLNDIEDMLLLIVQHKLFHLGGDAIVDLTVALQSSQKKLNITKPQKDFHTIFVKEPYTPSFDPQGVIYEDLSNGKRFMRADELYKFSD
ncbi:hypothetical protein Tco_0803226 [Tanacetum coccineum]|uniref:Uncharacterized protein n=1 Tax=Tanacetum coccineum TaxID=301880 RepID=A0ABQ5A5C4_9ASTR